MEWVKLVAVPAFYMDPALLRAGEAAEVLFCRALAHCGAVESAGVVDKTVLPMLVTARAQQRADALVREGLWLDEGQHYRIRSWDKWQDQHDLAAEKRAAARERKRRERDKKRATVTADVTPPVTRDTGVTSRGQSIDVTPLDREGDRDKEVLPTEGHTPRAAKPPSEPPTFLAFWQAYPKRVGRKAAVTAYQRALKTTDPTTLLTAATRYANETRGIEARFIAHPQTWLNQGRWDDEPIRPDQPQRQSTTDQRVAQGLSLVERFRNRDPLPPLELEAGA